MDCSLPEPVRVAVYLVEPTDVIAVAGELVRANGLGDRVELIQGRIEDVTLPEAVDVITSVMTGNFLLSEDLLPSLFVARDRHLKPDGILLPSAATMCVAPVSAPALYEKEVACWSDGQRGLCFDAVRPYAANSVFVDRTLSRESSYLAPPADLLSFDLARATTTRCDAAVDVRVEVDGTCHGWLGWFRMVLGAQEFSTAPDEPRTHWAPLFLPIDPPVEVTAGERIALAVVRPAAWRLDLDHGVAPRRGQTLDRLRPSPHTPDPADGHAGPLPAALVGGRRCPLRARALGWCQRAARHRVRPRRSVPRPFCQRGGGRRPRVRIGSTVRTMTCFQTAYGLRIRSNVPIPGLRPASFDADARDVDVSVGPFPDALWDALQAPHVRWLDDDLEDLVVSRVAHRYVRFQYAWGVDCVLEPDSGRVWVSFEAPRTIDDAALYLTGPVLGFLLRSWGHACLHASSVIVGEAAVALVGASGVGKSTLAFALARRGHAIVADDVVLLRERSAVFEAVPAHGRLRVWPDAVEHIEGGTAFRPRLVQDWEKRYVALGAHSFPARPGPRSPWQRSTSCIR